MYKYVYIYTHIIYIYIYVHVYIIYIYMRVCICNVIYIYMRVCVCVCEYIIYCVRNKGETSDGDSLALVKPWGELDITMANSHCVVNVGQGHQDFTHDLLTVSFSDRENPLHLFQELWAPKVLHDHVVVVLKRVWQRCVRTTVVLDQIDSRSNNIK